MEKLSEIAQAMKFVAQAAGLARHRLSSGLALTLVYGRLHRSWSLSLSYQSSRPDLAEDDCRLAFGVAPSAQRTKFTRGAWTVIRLEWSEPPPEQLDLSGLPPAQERGPYA